MSGFAPPDESVEPLVSALPSVPGKVLEVAAGISVAVTVELGDAHAPLCMAVKRRDHGRGDHIGPNLILVLAGRSLFMRSRLWERDSLDALQNLRIMRVSVESHSVAVAYMKLRC